MSTLALKLVLTPALIALASLAGRRWGPAVSGWLIGLPFTSGPVALFLALSHGAAFATTAATGILAGTLSQAGFCLSYARATGRTGWPGSFAAASVAYACATAVLQAAVLPLGVLVVAVPVALLAALRFMPARLALPGAVAPPPWDLPARMLLGTAFVLLLTGLAPALGARLTGLLAPFPLYATILAAFAHYQQGPWAGVRVVRGLLFGLFGFTGFFVTLAALLQPAGIAPAFAAALAVALGIQACSLAILRRAPIAPSAQAR